MADMFDVQSQVNGYGGVGAASYRGMQQELLRRQQMQMAQDALERQAALDAQNAEKTRQDIAASRENVASNVEARRIMGDLHRQQTYDAGMKQVADALPINAPVSDEQFKTISGMVGPGNAVLRFAQRPAQPAVPGSEPLAPGIEGPERPAQPAQPAMRVFTGTEEQRTKDQRNTTALDTLAHKHDTGNETLDLLQRIHAMEFLTTGKDISASDAATILKEQNAGPANTIGGRRLAMQDLQARIDNGETPTKEELTALSVWQRYNPTELDLENARAKFAAKAADVAAGRADKAAEVATARVDTQVANQTKRDFRNTLVAEKTKLRPDLERVKRAQLVLSKPNFVTDVLAGPEVLQIMAGGMGSGLRMTEAELARVFGAQTKLQQLAGELSKWGFGKQQTIQNEMRTHMKEVIDIVAAARDRKDATMEDTLRKLADPTLTSAQVDQIHADYWRDQREAEALEQKVWGGGGGTTLPPGVTVTKRVSK